METLLVVTANGYGKRSRIDDYRITNRGGLGVINVVTSARNGKVVAIKAVTDADELMIMSIGGLVIRLPVRQISVLGRATQGVTLIAIEPGDQVVDVAHIAKEDRSGELGSVPNGAAGIDEQVEDQDDGPPESAYENGAGGAEEDEPGDELG